MRVLVIGGTGFLSGTVATRAIAAGHTVWTVTRGRRAPATGAQAVTVDRHDLSAFSDAIRSVGTDFDLVIDCICYTAEDARQDLQVFRDLTARIVFVSTDFVYAPESRCFPQPEYPATFALSGYGGKKREAESIFETSSPGETAWTIVRPGHIYGPGSLLGCLPLHGRDATLIETIRRGTPLSLVGHGVFLQQPIYVHDLADLLLGLGTDPAAKNTVFNAAGPDVIESRRYYEIIGEVLGCRVALAEEPIGGYLEQHPEKASFICHRVYSLARLAATSAPIPSTRIGAGLDAHVKAILST